jgi:DNA-binding transcriptional MerR regulator
MISASQQSLARPNTRLAYSRSELASLLGISTRSVQRLEDRGLLKSSKALRRKIYSHQEVMRFLDSSC